MAFGRLGTVLFAASVVPPSSACSRGRSRRRLRANRCSLRPLRPGSLRGNERHDRRPRGPRAQPPQRRPRASRDRLIVFTGLSGSGKSSLAFDTIYAEGQRRYVESLSAYARQFLGQMDKPDVDFIEGLSPGDLDRSEVGLPQPAFHRRHHHRDLRLPPAALRAHRRAALPELRAADHAPDAAADRRPRAAAPRRHPLPGAGARRARPQGRVPRAARRARGPGLHAGPRRR